MSKIRISPSASAQEHTPSFGIAQKKQKARPQSTRSGAVDKTYKRCGTPRGRSAFGIWRSFVRQSSLSIACRLLQQARRVRSKWP